MVPLDQDARREGRKAMEKSLTAAARVRRRFKAGRPARLSTESPALMDALGRVTREIGKAKDLMLDEGLDPDDIQGALVFSTRSTTVLGKLMQRKRVPEPAEMGKFYSDILAIAAESPIEFLGMLWLQRDREATGDDEYITWVTQFMGGPVAGQELLHVRERFRAGGSRTLDN